MPTQKKTSTEVIQPDVSQNVIEIFSSVIVDFELIEGSIYLCIYNLSNEPYLDVNISAEQKIHGTGRASSTDQLNIFKGIKYLAPHKRICILLDKVDLFYQKQVEMSIHFSIAYKNAAKQLFKYSLVHDLAIYKDLPTHSAAYSI